MSCEKAHGLADDCAWAPSHQSQAQEGQGQPDDVEFDDEEGDLLPFVVLGVCVRQRQCEGCILSATIRNDERFDLTAGEDVTA